MSPVLHYGVHLALLGGGLLVPGWLLGRALRCPAGFVGAVLGSAAILFNLILLLEALDVRLHAGTVGGGLAAVCAALWLFSARRRCHSLTLVATRPATTPRTGGLHFAALVAIGIGVAAILVRSTVEPLSGFDTYFRWDYLARLMVNRGSLGFYPAVSAADFRLYGWCDGIAPLIPALYFWAYTTFGSLREIALLPVVWLQVAALFWSIYQLAAHRGSPLSGVASCAVFASSAAALWGISMGQETAMTALGLVGLFWFLDRARDQPAHHGWLIWAGVAGGVSALAREYGLAFIALGAVAVAQQRRPLGDWARYLGTAAGIAGPWYARNWIVTGNPVWPQPLFGLFPTPYVHAEQMAIVAELGSPLLQPQLLVALLAALASVPFALAIAGTISNPRRYAVLALGITLVVALWFWSVGQTAGGYSYSIRVLTPALALAAVLGGAWMANLKSRAARWVAGVLLVGCATDAAARSLYLPLKPFVSWWQSSPAAWRKFEVARLHWRANGLWSILTTEAAGRDILVGDPSMLRRFSDEGARPLSLFSPSLAFLFLETSTPAAQLARLRATGARFILLPKNAFVERQLERHAFWRDLPQFVAPLSLPVWVLYDLDQAQTPRATPPPPP